MGILYQKISVLKREVGRISADFELSIDSKAHNSEEMPQRHFLPSNLLDGDRLIFRRGTTWKVDENAQDWDIEDGSVANTYSKTIISSKKSVYLSRKKQKTKKLRKLLTTQRPFIKHPDPLSQTLAGCLKRTAGTQSETGKTCKSDSSLPA